MPSLTVKPVARGFAYSVAVKVEGEPVPFPAGIGLRADVRDYPEAFAKAGSVSTDAGTITRIDDETIGLDLPATLTARLGNNDIAVLDLIRTDGAREVWMGIRIELPVEASATGAAA